MKDFITTLRNKPEPVKRRIFLGTMIGFSVIVFSCYVFSITRSITVVIDKEKQKVKGGLLGEFSLPSIKDSVSANVQDIVHSMKAK